jgi:hypothetical protein
MTTAMPNAYDTTTERVLFMALEVREKTWKLGFTIGHGHKPRERFSPPARVPVVRARTASPPRCVCTRRLPQRSAARHSTTWTGDSGWVRLRLQGFLGATASGRPTRVTLIPRSTLPRKSRNTMSIPAFNRA